MRSLAAIDLSEHRFSIQHFVRNKLIQHAIALVLLVFPFGFFTSDPAQAKTQICNGSDVEILIAYMWPDGTLGAGDLDYIKVEGWHALRPEQCERNDGRLRVAVAQLDGKGNWGFPDYTIAGSWSWQVFNRTRNLSCVAPPGKRFKYGPGPRREPCPAGFIETAFQLEAEDNNGLLPATIHIKTTVFPKLIPLEDAPVASNPDAPAASMNRTLRNSRLFAGAAPPKAPDPDAAKMKNFILEVIISRTIPLLCPNDYSLDGAATPDERAKALGIDNYQASVAGSVSAVLQVLDPERAANPLLKAPTTPEITKTAGWVTSVAKMLVEQNSCSNPVFLALAEPSHLYLAKAAKR